MDIGHVNYLQLSRSKFVPLHILFWIGVWFFFAYFLSYNSTNAVYVVWFSSFLLPVTMLSSYFTIYYLIPQYLLTRKYPYFILYGSYTLIMSMYLVLMSMFGCFIFLSNMNVSNMPPMSRNFIFVLLLVYLIVGFMSFVKLLIHNFETISKNKELQNQILENQLKLKEQELYYLKKQIHPHFLFNTLNTIYGFALKKSDQTTDIILKLSNLLDYILYQVQKPKVDLQEELEHIQEYIALEKIRFQDTLQASFESNISNSMIEIPPMLFIPFVENAFKHGSIINDFLTISIQVELKNNRINFRIENTIKEHVSKEENKSGGLTNIQKRLSLLYKNTYQLETKIVGNWYQVYLSVPKSIT